MEKDYLLDYGFEIYFLKKLLNEKIHFARLEGTEKGEIFNTFLNGGTNACYYGDDYSQINYYTAGLYVTNEPIFKFFIGKFYIIRDEYIEEGIKYLKEYIISEGASKLFKAYEYLGKYYKGIDNNKCGSYNRRSNRLKLVMNMNECLGPYNNPFDEFDIMDEVEDIINNGNKDELINNYELFSNQDKILALRKIKNLGEIDLYNKIKNKHNIQTKQYKKHL